MKPFYLFLFLLTAHFPLSAQTIHALLLGNTESTIPEFGAICEQDIINIKKCLEDIEKTSHYQVAIHELTKANFTPTALDSVLNNLVVKKEDVLFFYYSGAAFCEAESPNMNRERGLRMGKDGKTNFRSAALFPQLENMGARLNIFFIDACALVRSVEPFGSKKAATENKVYESLFSACGTVTIFSSQCKEYSYGDANGSLLTNAFIDALEHYTNTGSKNLSWLNLLEWMQNTTRQKAADIFRLQHPTFFFTDFSDQCGE